MCVEQHVMTNVTGLFNALWMRPGSHLIQIIPYGWVIRPAWNPDKDWLIRGRNFKQLSRAAGLTYRWDYNACRTRMAACAYDCQMSCNTRIGCKT